MKKNMSKIAALLLSFVLVFAAVGCGTKASTTTKKNDEVKTKVMKSSDGKLQVSVPESWKEVSELKSINPLYVLGVGDKAGEMYLGVLSESKDNFKDMTLEKYYEAITTQLKTQIQNAEIANVKDAEINGCKAKTYEISGVVNNIKVTYSNAVIDSPKAFNQIYSWTLATKFSKNKATLENAVKTFKEN